MKEKIVGEKGDRVFNAVLYYKATRHAKHYVVIL